MHTNCGDTRSQGFSGPGEGDRNGEVYKFESVPFATGGEYAVCWCAGVQSSCTQTRDFSFSVGTLFLDGPYGDQRFTCIKGHVCSLMGIEGHGLQIGDIVVVTLACGDLTPLRPLSFEHRIATLGGDSHAECREGSYFHEVNRFFRALSLARTSHRVAHAPCGCTCLLFENLCCSPYLLWRFF